MGAYGSCGERHADSDLVAAIANGKSHCGAQIRMTNKGGHSDVGGAGRVITTWVKDTCTGCDANHVDLSVGSWNDLTGGSPWGVTDIEWYVHTLTYQSPYTGASARQMLICYGT